MTSSFGLQFFEKCLTLETGMSDFHKLIVTILKIKPNKLAPRIIKLGTITILEVKHLITNFQ